MKHAFSIFMSIVVFVTLSIGVIDVIDYYKNTPTKMADKIVSVNNASGVIIYSDETHSLIMTSYHVIWDIVSEKGSKIYVTFKEIGGLIDVSYEAQDIILSNEIDIAVITIHPGFKLHYAKLANFDPELGEDIFLISNPNYNYRTVTKGIISSKSRKSRTNSKVAMWQISGGIFYGSSGGGAFNTNGELIGIARSIDFIKTDFCSSKVLGKGKFKVELYECYNNPIPYLGFIVPLPELKVFLLSNSFGYIF